MEKQIFYHDTDAGGVVYYANYLKYMEEARVEFFRQKNLSETAIDGQAVFYPVRQCVITYHKPALYGERIICSATVKKITPARIIFDQKVTNAKTGELLVDAGITLACVRADNFQLMRIPESVLKQLTTCL
ncbi:MAG: thioesterase family protein [Candidatus Omnitrophota bacterium]